jgi:Arc/MetJ-type ribon-helix-helix transcriptional regulator
MASPNTTLRLSPQDEELIEHLQSKVNASSRTELIRMSLRELAREIAQREERVDDLVRRLEEFIPAFDPHVVDEAGFDPRRERAFVRVDDVTYLDMPAKLVFAERILEDGTREQTKVERGGENPSKRIWIGPVRIEA